MKNYSIFAAISIVLVIGAFFVGTQVGDSDSKETKSAESVETNTTRDAKTAMEDKMESEDAMSEDSMTMMEEKLELDSSLPTPAVSIKVEKDAMKGYNMVVTTKNFEFTPENANKAEGDTPQNEGHAHIYINGEKLTRLYGEYYYFGADVLKPGDKVTVSLNTNKHRSIVTSNAAVI